jgi:hypothetical protein
MVDGDFGDSFLNVYIAHLLHPANQLVGYVKWAEGRGIPGSGPCSPLVRVDPVVEVIFTILATDCAIKWSNICQNRTKCELTALQEVHIDPINQKKCVIDVDNVQVAGADTEKANQTFVTREP